jgi:hypothetical protein
MRPDVYIHPLSPAKEVNLQKDYRSAYIPWSRTHIQIGCPSSQGCQQTIEQLSQISRATMRRITAGYIARGLSRLARHPSGRIIIEIVPVVSGRIQVTVTRTCDTPVAIDSEEALLKEIVRLWPEAVIRREQPKALAAAYTPPSIKRGGPAGTPEHQRIQIVRGWLRVQGRMNQEIYASGQGIAASTLRRWLRQLREEGKL